MVRAVYEAVNQFESSDSPLLASPQGGVAERFKKHREASTDREAGVVFRMKTKRKTTPAASALVASRNFLMTQPPLLAVMQGGDYLLHSNLFTASMTRFTISYFPREGFLCKAA